MTAQVGPAARPVRLTWEQKTPATMDEAWEVLADTDQFNRVAKLGFQFKELPQADGTTLRQGEMKRLGMRHRWKDLPFQYRAPEWFRKERQFETGPLALMVIQLRLKPDKEGTAFRYTVELFPRHALLRPLVALEAHFFSRPNLDRTLQAALKLLAGQQVEGFSEPIPALDREQEGRLNGALTRLKPEKFARQLGSFIRSAPLREQDRMQPLRLARRWELSEDAAVEGFLRAAQEGVLSMKWDVVCPSCRMPKQRLESLAELTSDVHCPSCNVRFDGTFPDAVEVSFRPAPSIRDFSLDVACLGSPGRQPHIVAQERLEPGAETDFTLPLSPGAYRLRTWPPKETCSVEVRPKGQEDESAVQIRLFDLQPPRLRLVEGQRRIALKNVTDRGVEVILEKQWRAPDLLTAGRLLENARARELLPGGVLPPGFKAELFRGAVLVVEVLRGGKATLDSMLPELQRANPRFLKVAELRIISVWGSVETALGAARVMKESEKVRCGLNLGAMLESPESSQRLVMGEVVEKAIECLRGAGPGVIALPESSSQAHELDRALARIGAALVPPDYQMPGAAPAVWIRM